MKRASYRHAVEWVAFNDNSGSGDPQREVAGYVTTLLVADLFAVDPDKVARDIMRVRKREGFPT